MTENNKQFPYRRVYTGMPVYNGEPYLEESIRCNLNQSYDDFGLIISDNASTDKTEEICRDYAAGDSRIQYIRNPVNVGAAPNYNRCFEPANSEFFRWSNADDLIEESLIEDCLALLEQHPDAILAYGQTRIIDADGNFVKLYEENLVLSDDNAAERFLTCRTNLGLSNVIYGLMRRDLVAKTALFGSYVASDCNLIAELALYGKFVEVPKVLFSRRMHEEASSYDRGDAERQKNFWKPGESRLYMQFWRRTFAYFRAVLRGPLDLAQKRKLFWHLSKTVYWKKGLLFSELANYMRFGFLRRS
jgi:glycosyltransferase involved in cell wall biosynthesis